MTHFPHLSEHEVFRIYFSEHGFDSLVDKIPQLMENFVIIDAYIRNYRRHEAMRTLVESAFISSVEQQGG